MLETKKYFKKLDDLFSKNCHDFIKLIPNCKQFDANQIAMIYKALYKAISLHDGQYRKTGEPYVNHPIAAASILAIYGLDYETVCAALLHDTLEDTSYTLEECEVDFGSCIASLVDSVTKIGTDVNNPTHEKIITSAKQDVRSVAVKLGDRLHNMHTLSVLSEEKQKEIANETKEFYVPITRILGIYQLKDELQDQCLYYLSHDEFLSYYKLREKLKQKHGRVLEELADKVQEQLSILGIGMRYNYRVKNVGGIYDEVINGKKPYEIEDLLAIKMILNNVSMCYQTLGIVNHFCKPIPKSMQDFISMPKANGYKSLNTNGLYNGAGVQVRIRTDEMQKVNDLGVFSDLDADTEKNVTDQMKLELSNLSRNKVHNE